MIPTIGVMIGWYIITRMLSFLTRKEERQEGIVVRVFAIFTIIVTIIGMLDLMSRGSQMVSP